MVKSWEFLANYESFELVKRAYRDRHQRDANTGHSREIAASFTHARSYFRAAHFAEQTVKPLLFVLWRGSTLSRLDASPQSRP